MNDVLQDAWNNPLSGGAMNPNNGSFLGKTGYPLNAAGHGILDIRVGANGVHVWPVR